MNDEHDSRTGITAEPDAPEADGQVRRKPAIADPLRFGSVRVFFGGMAVLFFVAIVLLCLRDFTFGSACILTAMWFIPLGIECASISLRGKLFLLPFWIEAFNQPRDSGSQRQEPS